MANSSTRSRRGGRSAAARPAKAPAVALDGAPAPAARTERWISWGRTAVAAGLGIAILAMILGPHRIGDYMAETDFYGAYANGARLVQQGHLDPARYGVIGPGYEILLGLVGFAIPNLFVAAELLSLASTLITLLLWFALIRRRVDGRAALAGAVLYAINTYVFRYGYSATTDAVAVALQAGSLYLLLARGGPRAVLGAGILGAAAFLTRYNAIYLLPAGLLAIFAGAIPGATPARAGPEPAAGARAPGRVALAVRFAAGFIGPVVPWVIYSLGHGSKFSFQLHHNIAYEVFARSKGIPWDNYQKFMQPQFHNLWDVIARDPSAVVTRMFVNVAEHLRDDGLKLLGPWTAAAAACGILFLVLDRRARAIWPLLAAAALLFLTLVPAFYSERYSLALVPVYAALGGIAFGSPRLALVARGAWLKPLLLLLPIYFGVRANVAHQTYAVTQLPVEVLDAAETLRQLKRPGDRVIARKPHLAFHAGVEAAPFPFADSLEGLANDARKLGARWMFFSWPEAETRPAFWHLLDTTGVVPGLTVRRVTSPHPSVLYEIGPEFGRRPAWFANDTLRAWHMMRARTMVDVNSAELLEARGSLARALGYTTDARASLQRAVGLEPKRVSALVELGALGYETGDYDLSIRALERALGQQPDNVQARMGLGWAYLAVGRDTDAAAAWRPIVNSVGHPATLRRMEQLFRNLGDAGAAAAARAALSQPGLP